MYEKNYLELLARFEVPSEVLDSFIKQAVHFDLIPTLTGINHRLDHLVLIPYTKEKEDHFTELNQYLNDLIFEEHQDYFDKLSKEE